MYWHYVSLRWLACYALLMHSVNEIERSASSPLQGRNPDMDQYLQQFSLSIPVPQRLLSRDVHAEFGRVARCLRRAPRGYFWRSSCASGSRPIHPCLSRPKPPPAHRPASATMRSSRPSAGDSPRGRSCDRKSRRTFLQAAIDRCRDHLGYATRFATLGLRG